MSDQMYCCKIEDLSERPDLTTEFLATLDWSVSSWIDREHPGSHHIVYSNSREEAESKREELENKARQWRQYGVRIGDIETFLLEKKDWAEEWKKYFKVMKVSPRLVIKPSWLEHQAKPEEIVIMLDPGMSFGTGRHPTTSFCLRMLDRIAADAPSDPGSFLDAGCGSGILSIGAVKLGFSPVEAFDIDPEATTAAAANFAENGVTDADASLTMAGIADVKPARERRTVAANILAPCLVEHRRTLADWVEPGGHLILSGILASEYDLVRSRFEELNFEEIETEQEEEWQSGMFIKQ